ncbi:ABC1 family-domain-containing protein [Jimgerdemannia flammicorona]|uniref:ABC1 family-domain-containing protein n=1 Tax=Jimgerdemannia flammicorona TaxID=994334 RepID=A0A433QG93_9FUNG|nr:ABC1 family-domain-containing protein [Jimgerdemannia flammicorona]
MFRRPNPRLTRRLALLTTTFAGLYVYDEKANAQVLQRNTRTLYNGLVLAADYKLNFTAKNAAGIDDLHERVARRLLHVCKANGGLYIKLGQTIGAQSAVLPAAYQRHFRTLYDAAPAVGYDEVVKIFLQEFGVHPSDVFAEFSHEPVASASIAQVHRATLRNGTVVAVKVQKPEIRAQMGWDLMAYRALLTLYERLFDLPLKWSADYTERHLRMEADFENEGRNSELAWRGVQEEPTLKGRVYIPKVFWEYTGKRVLVCEWIDGVRLTDVDGLENIGVKPEEAMRTAVDMFASQIFQSGFVHGE